MVCGYITSLSFSRSRVGAEHVSFVEDDAEPDPDVADEDVADTRSLSLIG